MRMLRVALVLFVLVSFIGATMAVSMAATVTPTVKPTAKATMKPTAKSTMKPINTTGKKMFDLQQMTTNIGSVFKKLSMGTKSPAKSGAAGNNTTAKTGANKTASGMDQQKSASKYSPSLKPSTSPMRSIQAPAMMNQLGSMPKIGSMDSLL